MVSIQGPMSGAGKIYTSIRKSLLPWDHSLHRNTLIAHLQRVCERKRIPILKGCRIPRAVQVALQMMNLSRFAVASLGACSSRKRVAVAVILGFGQAVQSAELRIAETVESGLEIVEDDRIG